jgi:hypothetical protein
MQSFKNILFWQMLYKRVTNVKHIIIFRVKTNVRIASYKKEFLTTLQFVAS